MGVGPLGLFLVKMGHDVFGYDDYPDAKIVSRLQSHGIVMLEHLHGKRDFDEVIVSRAIQYTPDRLKRFEKRYSKAKIVFRGDYLAKLAKQFKSVVIAGTHGKTSTTGNLVSLLQATGTHFSYIVGGYFANNAVDAAHYDVDSKWLVIEVDESDGTIENFKPDVAVVTNIELDHVDYYETESRLLKVFNNLVARARSRVFLGEQAALTLGLDPDRPKRKHEILSKSQQGDPFLENRKLAEAVAVWICGDPGKQFPEEIAAVERRQEVLQLPARKWVVTDYAHHPSELAALKKWVNSRFSDAVVHWIFQPHRYSRTVALKDGFVRELSPLNPCLLPEYPAFEAYVEAGSSRALLKGLEEKGSRVKYCETPLVLSKYLHGTEEPDYQIKPEVYVFAGAGDIVLWRDWVVHSLSGFPSGMAFSDIQLSDEQWLSFHQARFEKDGSYVACDETLKRKTTLNVGGNARFYVEPASLESLQLVLKTSKMLGLEVHMMGKGSNLLVSDSGIDAVVIRLNKELWTKCEHLGGRQFWLGAGLSLKRFGRAAMEAGVSGFSFLDGIPGSVGGAVRMNAGAMGSEMGGRVLEVECLDYSGKRVRLSREELGFTYRHCKAAEKLIVLHVLVEGKGLEAPAKIEESLESMRQKRIASQPAEPSAGCMFKNPTGDSAGRLIDQAGLKGFRIGGASISQKHGNFLVTSKDTYAGDVLAVIEHVRAVVKEHYGVQLEQEIQMFPANLKVLSSEETVSVGAEL